MVELQQVAVFIVPFQIRADLPSETAKQSQTEEKREDVRVLN